MSDYLPFEKHLPKNNFKSSRAYHCPTCKCANEEYYGYNPEKTSAISQRINQRQSRVSHLLSESKVVGVVGENVSHDKITWFKSLSPKPKNVIFHFASPPQTLTRSMIR